jgi:competence ComEA-like helix-hairpin-helix protein
MHNANRGTREERRRPHSGVPEEGQTGDVGTSGSDEQSFDLNHAAATQLAAIDELGTQLAEAIIQHRVHHGHFTSWDQLTAVPGMGPAEVAALRRAARLAEHPQTGDDRVHRSQPLHRGGLP